jgi:hypothetical protein
MFHSLCEHIPSSRRELKKCRAAYFHDGVHLVKRHFRQRLLEEYSLETPERQRQLRNTSGLIGEVFIELYEQLTAPPRGKKILLISQQLNELISSLSKKELGKLFVDGIDKHVYYICGFLCRAGEKEAERRTQDTNSDGFAIGQCIKEVSSHFVSQKSASELETVKESLPEGVTSLVDKWSVYGGLKYPNRQMYYLIAKIEYCYLNLATTDNLRTYGGIVLSYICSEIATNESLVDHFSSLLRENHQYEKAAILAAFRYYVKVFGNLRVKDLCRKFNAQLHKSTTAALRPSLATNGSKRKKSKRKSKIKRRPKEAEEVEDESDETIHNDLIDIADEPIEYDSDSNDNA